MKAVKPLILSLFALIISFHATAQSAYNSSRVLLYDDYHDNSNEWAVKYSSDAAMGVSNGHYFFEHKRSSKSWLTYKRVDNFNTSKDWTIETRMRHTSGIRNNGFGLLFGRENNENQYEFFISCTGYYIIKKYRHGTTTYMSKVPGASSSWTSSSYIKKGEYDYNTLKVVQQGGQWKFYINGNYVKGLPAETLPGQRVGYVIYKKQRVEVDYISVKEMGSSNTYVNNNNYNKTNQYSSYNSPPSIKIYEPQTTRGLNVVKAKTIHVAGKATDTDGVFEVKVNGMDAQLMSDGYFTIEIPLAIGQNTITVSASDTKRKASTQTFKIKREQTYNPNPVVNNKPVVNNNNNYNNVPVQQKRLALLIGNGAYQNGGNLSNPVNDVRSMKMALESLGFTVLKHENCTQKMMRRAMDEFGQKLPSYDIALFFYAGHGVQVDGSNYLVPTDAALKTKNDVEYDCVQAGRILGKMEASNAKTNIVILDACRDNPFERSWSRSTQGKGLAFMNAPSGSFVAYATSPGKTASDGIGQNGLYTSALLQHIKTPGLAIEEVFKRVRKTVKKQSGGKQVPWESTSLEGSFKFK